MHESVSLSLCIVITNIYVITGTAPTIPETIPPPNAPAILGTIPSTSPMLAPLPAASLPPPLPPPPLAVPKERDLMNDVAAKALDKWLIVGTMLGIHSSVLYSFRDRHNADPIACYLAVFHHWQTSIDCLPYTWDTIAEVLEMEAVHRRDLAAAIRRKYL